MSENKINIYTQGGPVINGGTFSNVQFVAQQNVVYNTDQKCANTSGDIDEVAVVMNDVQDGTKDTSLQKIPESVESCFIHTSGFVRDSINAVIRKFYVNMHSNLALIEITLFDHGQLHKRNLHKLFVNALIDWGILSGNGDTDKIVSGMAAKFRNIPKEGYKSWDSFHTNDRELCVKIGRELPESMRYNR